MRQRTLDAGSIQLLSIQQPQQPSIDARRLNTRGCCMVVSAVQSEIGIARSEGTSRKHATISRSGQPSLIKSERSAVRMRHFCRLSKPGWEREIICFPDFDAVLCNRWMAETRNFTLLILW